MKYLPASFLAILLTAVATPYLRSQEPAPEPSGRLRLEPVAPPKTDSLLPENQGGLPLIPELPQPDKAPKEKKTRASAAEDALRDQIKLRVAKTKAQEDPELQAIWDSHYKARTDYEQRKILTRYYTLLCDRIAKLDKTIKPDVVEALRVSYFNDYTQNRITPSEQPKDYVDPAPPKPAPKAAAKPTPKPKQ